MKNLVVDEKYNQKKLHNFLSDLYPSMSSSTFYKALRQKDIRVNGQRIKENVTLQTGDSLQVYISDELLYPFLKEIKVIYEDDNILAANKPAGLEVVGENSMTSYLQSQFYFSYLEPCHRIDRNTTGLVLFAKNTDSLSILEAKFKQHEIEKHYLATVYGILPKKKDILHAYLFKDAKKSIVYISDTPKKGYRPIITSYTVLRENKEQKTSLLDISIETGRTHQIRAHMAHIGFPILGDEKYGNHSVNKKYGQKTQNLCSYCLIFRFTTPSGILDYLNGKKIEL